MAKRASLKEFQEQFAAKLSAAYWHEAAQAMLSMESGQTRWLVGLAAAGEVMPVPPLTLVPLVKNWFAGIANIRGDLYTVVDFSAFRGEEPTPRNANARLLLTGSRYGINCALLVNRTLGLKKAESFVMESAPANAPHWVAARYHDESGQTWLGLDTEKLMAEPAFLDAGSSL